MNHTFHSQLIKKHPHRHARVMKMNTPHGEIITPVFMPVGTRAFVNHLLPTQLEYAGSQIILGGNTYHMLLSPGLDIIKNHGGMHAFMAWNKPMLTDSGGFQVFSLSKKNKLCQITEDGAQCKHPHTGSMIHLTPQTAIETQKITGADIIMAFDQCTPDHSGYESALAAMERTHRWLIQSKTIHDKQPHAIYGHHQALFGIIQGGRYRDLREKSTQFIVNIDPDGIAIGGESIGFDMKRTIEIIDWVRPTLPIHKIRYAMGVGLKPQDLIEAVNAGMDIFDCVAPTRNARHGSLYHGKPVTQQDWIHFDTLGEEAGRILIKKSQYAHDDSPILEGCICFTCQHHSRAYLHYLFKSRATLYSELACVHNITIMHQVCDAMRQTILNNTFS